ncbi:hypothetical protein [Vibrio agarivorans]|uniref:hypothetical protein n=1 Tax=Vibrio agarivorans TaxID=153622 RepID=UPI002232A96F|nr:hypothetical protein [Vibrio agarivorans]MDN3663175.1 hypothetical protein [Vibrio agarivorans]
MKQLFWLTLVAVSAPFANAQDSMFPIWGEEAEARGYTLPKPWGLSLSYMDMNNPITVNNIGLSGTPLLESVDIDATKAQFKGSNITLRGDLWLFPFLNVYGILGQTRGESTALIESVTYNGGWPCHNGCTIDDLNIPFTLDMDGTTYGAGTTIAGGVGNWFALVDMNYTLTNIDAIDGEIKTFVAAPRVGHRWQYDGGKELRVWVGAMYQDVQQYLSGNIGDIIPQLADILEDGRFEVQQSADDKWNGTAGFQYAFNRDWDILFEAGFGSRETLFVALGRRF